MKISYYLMVWYGFDQVKSSSGPRTFTLIVSVSYGDMQNNNQKKESLVPKRTKHALL